MKSDMRVTKRKKKHLLWIEVEVLKIW